VHRPEDEVSGRVVEEEHRDRLEAEAPHRPLRERAQQRVELEGGGERAPEIDEEGQLAGAPLRLGLDAQLALERVEGEGVLHPPRVEIGERRERLVVGAGEATDLVVALDRHPVQEVAGLRALHRGAEPPQRIAHEEADDEDVGEPRRGREQHEPGEHEAEVGVGARPELARVAAEPEGPARREEERRHPDGEQELAADGAADVEHGDRQVIDDRCASSKARSSPASATGSRPGTGASRGRPTTR
jgi:hypothetical protein